MKKKISSFIYYAVIVVLVGVFIFSGWKMYSELKEYQKDEQAYKELEQFVEVLDVIDAEEKTELMSPEERILKVDFNSLMEINSDCIGWIYIANTAVSYPVVQGKDNDYYLRHLFNKEYGISGTVFMDVRNNSDLSDRHTILYGHHMKNGTMFGNVENYEEQSYADKHPVGLYITPKKVYQIEFFAGYQTDAYDNSWMLDFTDAEFVEWIAQAKEKSDFVSDVTPSVTDHIMTLSTCSYDQADGRFVLLGVLRESE